VENLRFANDLAVTPHRLSDGSFRLKQGKVWAVASVLCGKPE
jgi:hypothetical protein